MDGAVVGAVLGAVLVGTTLQRVSGTGVGLVVSPTLALLLGPAAGVLLTNATTTVSALLIMLAVRRDVQWLRYAQLVPGIVVGAVPGALLVRVADPGWLEVVVGGGVLLGVLTAVTVPRVPRVSGAGPALAAGAVGGFLNTTAGVAAPAMVVYALASRWAHRPFAATLQPTFMTMGAVSVLSKVALGAAGPAGTPPWWLLATMVLTVVAGVPVGGWASRHVSAHAARRVAVALSAAGAGATLVRGVVRVLG